ncbi:hypothetical protein CSKR_112733 [Clonorchis sinensis]|uniref:Uncharacterized protein n=1 Tax=Clonorchis sinensis TaxID=79923 RepID=A0A3R7FEV5_CLOSI|nr:hypothetical protein CSKR_112733 [Clonorchis sinensis]
MRKDKKFLFEAETMMYISTEKVPGMTITESTYEDSKSALLKHVRGKISPGLLHKEHYLLIYPERQMRYPEWAIIRLRLHYITVLKPEDLTFPEQWQVGLQGVIDSLGAADDLGANFQLPVYADHTREFDILTKEQGEPDACEMVENMLSHIQLGSHKCFPQIRMAGANGETYMRANALIPTAGLEVPELGVEKDLQFVVLLKRLWGENKYSIYTYSSSPVYESFSDPGDENYFILETEGYAHELPNFGLERFASISDPAAIEVAKTVIVELMIHQLEIPATLIDCPWLYFFVTDSGLLLRTNLRISKTTHYWNEENPWTVPLKVSEKLQMHPDRTFNVLWRRQAKYPIRQSENNWDESPHFLFPASS